jgi:hypothetical protein
MINSIINTDTGKIDGNFIDKNTVQVMKGEIVHVIK